MNPTGIYIVYMYNVMYMYIVVWCKHALCVLQCFRCSGSPVFSTECCSREEEEGTEGTSHGEDSGQSPCPYDTGSVSYVCVVEIMIIILYHVHI